MKRLAFIAILLLAVLAVSLGASRRAFFAVSRTAYTNEIVVTPLTNFSTTALATSYTTPAFTPVSNSLIMMPVHTSPVPGGYTVTNDGATQLVWHSVGFTNDSGNSILTIFVTALPIGLAPFSMTVNIQGTAVSWTGGEGQLYSVTGCDQTAAYGSNAIASIAVTNVTATTTLGLLTFNAPNAYGENTLMAFTSFNSTLGQQPQSPWTEGFDGNHSTPSYNLMTAWTNNVRTITSYAATNNSSQKYMGAVVEIRAGITQ